MLLKVNDPIIVNDNFKIFIKNRCQAHRESYGKFDTTAIISINTPGDSANTFCKTHTIRKVLTLFFSDIGVRDTDGIPMSKEDAKKIADFVKWLKTTDTKELWIHCDAGVSRSAAVGAAILKYLTGDDSAIFNNPNYIPNSSVYRLTLEALYKMEEK
jgi:predicted protein tyrosine phosphatase